MQNEVIDNLIELSDPQYEFLTSHKKNTGFVAGFGSGKSFIGTLKTLLKVIDNGIPRVAYYLPTYGDIRDIAFVGFPEVCNLLGYDYKLNKTDKEFRIIDNGEEIGIVMFRNMSEPEGIVGYQVGYSLIDETDILPKEKMSFAFKKILGRNRLIIEVENEDILQEYYDTGLCPEGTYWHQDRCCLCWINSIDVAGTPEGFKWFYQRFVREAKDSDMLIKASTYSNLHNLSSDFIQTMKDEYPPNLFEAYVNGDFINLTTGTVLSYFDREIHDTKRISNEYDILHIGQDFNVRGCVSTVHVIDIVDGVEVTSRVDEFESYDTKEIISNIKQRYPKNTIVIYPDASGDSERTNASKSDIQMLKDANFMVKVPNRNGYVRDRINAYNGLLSHNRYLVNTSKCPKGTEALEQQAWDKNGNPEKFSEPASIDDYNDSSGYFVVRRFPLKGGHSESREFIV